VGELKEKVGMALIPTLSDYAEILVNIISKQDGANESTQKWIDRFVTLNKYLNPGGQLISGLKIASDAARSFARSIGLLGGDEVTQLNRVMTNTGAKVWETKLAFSALTAEKTKDTTATKANNEETKKATEAKKKLAAAAKQLAADLKDARDALTEQFAVALKGVTDKLDAAKAKFDEFSATVSGVFTSALSFKDAYEAGSDAGGGFISGLTSQVDQIKKFGELTNRLIAAGLSQDALQLVLDAGVESGTAIAEELLNGAGNILTANALVADAKTMADRVGLNAANSYFKAGVDAATAMVQGMQSIIDKYVPMMNAPGISPSGVASLGASFGAESTGNFDQSVLGMLDWNTIFQGITLDVGGLATLASGGLVTSPTIALIGEGGQPEAVIPLDRMGEMGGGGGNITINVNGGDPNAVVDALRSYMFRNGSIPIRVSG
jgi:hypothetical protein